MKIFKSDSALEQKIVKVEKLMQELGLSIVWNHQGLCITEAGVSYPIVDTESRDTVTQFPRTFDSERICFSRE